MKKTLLVACLALTLASCTDDSKSRRVLEEAGYTEIEITGYSPFSCSKGDTFATGFRAKGPSGKAVEGTVCCGVLKGCMIRLD